MDGQTDGQTDRILIARPRLHYMQRGNNVKLKLYISKNDKRYHLRITSELALLLEN